MMRGVAVVLGATILTTVGVHAFDGGIPARMWGSVMQSVSIAWSGVVGRAQVARSVESGSCFDGMVAFSYNDTHVCVDQYEASPSATCPHRVPTSALETEVNVNARGCGAVSREGAIPWRHISQEQAATACRSANKELIDTEVWYHIARTTAQEGCYISEDAVHPTGSTRGCVTPEGVHDLIGNVWEWTLGVVESGVYDGRVLPESGYVVRADDAGMPITTTGERGAVGAYERFWLEREGTRGIMRGGYFKSGDDAGVYALHAGSLPTFAGSAVGFRCMQRL